MNSDWLPGLLQGRRVFYHEVVDFERYLVLRVEPANSLYERLCFHALVLILVFGSILVGVLWGLSKA